MPDSTRPVAGRARALSATLVGGALLAISALAAAPIAAQTLTIASGFAPEGDTGTNEIFLTVSLSSPQPVAVSVDWATQAVGTGQTDAQPGADYVEASGTLVFAPQSNSESLSVLMIGDYEAEQNEIFRVVLSNPQNAVLNNSFAFGVIQNDDVRISISGAPAIEGDVGTTILSFPVSLDGTKDVPVSAAWNTEELTGSPAATADVDFVAASGVVTFGVGQSQEYIDVQVIGDTEWETTEIFSVVLSDPVFGSIGVGTGVGQIQNDDVRMSIGNAAAVEGDVGTSIVSFAVSLSGTKGVPVSATWTAEEFPISSAATADVDFVAESGTVVFAVGQSSANIGVQVIGDTELELQETFRVVLSDPVNGSIGVGSGLGQILNDDAGIYVSNASVAEGDSGTTYLDFTISLSMPEDSEVEVAYTTSPGTATPGEDYQPVSGTTVIPFGSTTGQVPVAVFGDTEYEDDEVLYLNLSNPVGASIVDSQGIGTIQNEDEPAPVPALGMLARSLLAAVVILVALFRRSLAST